MRHSRMKRLLSFMMAAVMVLTLGFNSAYAVETGDTDNTITVERLDPSDVSASLIQPGEQIEENSAEDLYADTDVVRVMIVLEEAPAISLMHSADDALTDGSAVAAQREYLINVQNSIADTISAQALGGRALDVQWNLTLVANAISANVEFGKIDEIAGVDGVKAVYLEVQYMPLEADVSNIVSQQMTGASAVQNSGYTGAGTRIAVIDTGTDTDHQSFSGAAFEYALAELAEKNGMSYDAYVDTLNLLSVEEIASVLDQLHIYSRHGGGLTAGDLYINSKLPFNYNYVDLNLSMGHEDTANEHGSHVAGISTANRYIDCAKVYDFDGTGAFDEDDAQAVMSFLMGGKTIENVDYADLSGNGTITTYDVHLLLDALEDYEANGVHYISAYDSVRVTGVAPDAQLLTMKVFGANGGAYASDYMAAVEDSIVLGCDVVNLSLGDARPGFNTSYDSEWSGFVNGIMERVAESGIVMSVAAGNSGSWAANSETGTGMLYTDEAGSYTIGEPATYENALSVASADNVTSFTSLQLVFAGADGEEITVAPYYAVLNENYDMSNWAVLDEIDPNYAPTAYELVFLGDPTDLFIGAEQTDMTIYAGDVSDFDGYDFTGKVVLVARGTYNFSDKHTNAALAGAAAVIIYNNVPGAIQPNITGTSSDIPCLGISLEEAAALYNAFERNAEGLYAGALSVTKHLDVDFDDAAEYPAMSSFSSWGTTGDLRIKPEITAPGGSIYSVNGLSANGDGYEMMSGTSMAAPHLSGLTALLSQYFKENGILDKTGMTARVLAQSLLMSTAEPLIEEATGVEYSVRNQGAGLANIANAVNSNAYIMVAGQDDGKVKAELGDGTADRTVKFTITNFGDSALTYDLSASILTTDTVAYNGMTYSANGMTVLDADVTFSAYRVTVAAGETVTVTATISIPAAVAAEMEDLGYTNGFYMEGFLYIDPIADSEGVMDAAHSIPLLGWYGNWSDPSMYDSGTFIDYAYGTLERPSHINTYTKNVLTWEPVGYGQGLYYTGNIYGNFYTEDVIDEETGAVIGVEYIVEGDQRYIEARNAISSLPTSQWQIYAIFPSLIRSAGDFKVEVVDANTGEIYYVDDYEQYDDNMYGSFYWSTYGQWYDTTTDYGIGLGDWKYTDANGDPLSDGTQIEIRLTCVPEYFVENDGTVDWENIDLGEDATLSYTFTIDNTAPDLVGDSLDFDQKTRELTFTVQDNNYIAAVMLLNGSASELLDYYYPDMDEDERGEAVSGKLDLSGYEGKKIAIAICDYAGNETYYAINLGGEGASYDSLIGFQPDPDGYPGTWVTFTEGVAQNETALFTGTADFICAEYVNGHVYAQDETGKFYGIPYEDMLANSIDLEACYITTLEYIYQDLAYSYAEGKLYGLTTEELYGSPQVYINSINLGDPYFSEDKYEDIPTYGEDLTPLMQDAAYGLTLACDDNGSLYMLALKYEYDEDWNLVPGETAHLWRADLEENEYTGEIQLAYSFTDLGDTGLEMDYLQSMTWDHNSETLYWARFYPVSWFEHKSELIKFSFNEDGTPVIDEDGMIATEIVGTLSGETCALIAPLSDEAAAKDAHSNVPEFDGSVIAAPSLATKNVTLVKNGTTTLTCTFNPWYSEYTDVVWTSSDETVAVVDQNGKVTAVGDGSCTITVTSADDPTLYDTCDVTVASLTLDLEGIISYSSGGVNSITGSKLYSYAMNAGVPNLELGDLITAPEEFMGYGLNIVSAIHAKGSIWACEFGNAGMIYEIDPLNGVIRDMLSPIDGDMMFGLSYSEATGMFTGIMNYYLYTDLPLTHEAEEEMLGSYDENLYQFTWHKYDLSNFLAASDEGFATGETGQGSIVDVVFAGITDIDNTTGEFYSVYKDAFGTGIEAYYAPTTTHVILDNVGRLWYIDEVANMTYETDDGGTQMYNDAMGNSITTWDEDAAVFSTVYHVDDDTDLHNVFVIRDIEETPLTDMYRDGTMPRITYHFSAIYYAGKTAEGAPVYYLSLYDYWNEGSENLLYLYVGGVGTGQYDYDENWNRFEIKTEDALYELGGTGTGNIIATITNATPASEIEGLPPIKFPEIEEDSGWSYAPANMDSFVGFFRADEKVENDFPTVTPSAPNYIAACVNRLS